MGRKAQAKRRRAVDQRSTQWGTVRLHQPPQTVDRSEFGRVDTDDAFPVAWFHDGRETRELHADGSTRPTSWRKL
jgi:hypothetical protein